MQSDWPLVRLGEIAKVIHGWPFKSELFAPDDGVSPVVVGIGNYKYSGGFRFDATGRKVYKGDFPTSFQLKPFDILLVMTCQTEGGEILGIPGTIPDDGRIYLHNQRMGKVVVTKPDLVSKRFLYWLCLTKDFNDELKASATGTKILHTAPSRIEDYVFPLPSLDLQHRISSILDELEYRIETNEHMNRELEALLSVVFRSWFVEFEPVLAKADGRRPVALDDELTALFPSEYEEVSGMIVPKGWGVLPLDGIADFKNGLALQNYPANESGTLPIVKIAELRAGSTEGAELAAADVPAEVILDDGDVVFSWSGTLMARIWCGGKGALNQHLFKVTSNRFPKWFYYCWTLEHLPEFQDIADDKKTTMGHIKRHHLTDAKVTIPPPLLMEAANRILSPLLERHVLNSIQSRALTKLRDALLSPLMSGEFLLPDVGRRLETALA